MDKPISLPWSKHEVSGSFTVFILQDCRFRAHVHAGFHEILFPVSGSCRQESGGQERTLQRGEMMFVRETDAHEMLGGDAELVNVAFQCDWLERVEELLESPGLTRRLLDPADPPVIPVPEAFGQALESDARHLLHVGGGAFGQMLFSAFLLKALALFLPVASDTHDDEANTPPWLSSMLGELQQEPHRLIDVDELVRRSGHTHAHVARTFRRYLDMTLSEFVNRRRMQIAARLLLYTQHPVAEIARHCGVASASHFSRVFSKTFGQTPQAYRQAHRGIVLPGE